MFYFFLYFVTAVYGFQFQTNGVDIKYNISSFKTCVKIQETLKLTPITGVSLNDCVSHCVFTQMCQGLVYKKQYPLCERYGDGNVDTHAGSCVHIKRDDIHYRSTGVQTCEAESDMCSNKECPYTNVTNGKPEGNMFSAGSTQTIKCDSGYVINGNNSVKCLKNGTWTKLPECWKECQGLMMSLATVDGNTTHVNVTCPAKFVISRNISFNINITTETLTCDKHGNWIPAAVECTHFNNILNVALHKNANQSSTSQERNATRATDGIWDANMTASNSCSHTVPYNEKNETQPWWEVDLQHYYSVKSVWILNRVSSHKRLHNITVYVGNHTGGQESNKCSFWDGVVPKGCTVKLNCSETIVGRYVRITKPNRPTSYSDDNLALCEVGVYEDQHQTPIDSCSNMNN